MEKWGSASPSGWQEIAIEIVYLRVFNLFIIANHILAEIRWVTLPRPSFACQFKGQGDIHDFCFLKIIQDKTRAEKGKSTCAIAQIRPRSPRGRLQARARQVVSSSPRKNQNLLQLSSFVKKVHIFENPNSVSHS